MSKGALRMPRVADPNKKDGKVYRSQIEASEKWEKENPQEKIIIRLPEGSKDLLTAYVKKKAMEEPGNPKYSTDKGRPSVNALIRTLLEEEIGINF